MANDAPIVRNGSTLNRDFSKTDKGKDLYTKAKSAVTLYASNSLFFHDVMRVVQNSLDVASGKAIVDASKANAANAEKRRRLSPGSFSIGATDYSNRPVIQVVKGDISTTRSGEQPLGEFADFILTNVTEADAERTDAIETFGEPHIFTSGRFMRKITFGGSVRTTCANPISTSAESRVPQHVLLRNFYERYMRSTAQAQFNYFTRVIVDGDIYEGYVNSMNIARDSSVEMTMPFSFTMLCLRRYHMNDNDAIQVLSRFNGETRRKLPPSFASAEMRDAVGDFSVRLSIGNDEPSTSIEYNTGKVTPDGTVSGINQSMFLHTPYGGQTLTLSGSGSELWTLVYADDGSDIGGSPSRGGKQLVNLKLKSYEKVLELSESNNAVSTCDLSIKSSVEGGATVRISSTASDKPPLKIKRIFVGGVAAAETGPNPNSFAVTIPNAHALFVDGGDEQSWTFAVQAFLGTNEKEFVASDYAVPSSDWPNMISYTFGEVNPVRAGLISTVPSDVALANGTIADASSPFVGGGGDLSVSGCKLTLSTPTVLTGNPFTMADAVRFYVQFRYEIPNYAPVSGQILVKLDFGNPTVVSNVFNEGHGEAAFAPGRKWGVTREPSGEMNGIIRFAKTPAAAAANLDEEDVAGMLLGAQLRLQYNSGGLNCRMGFPTSSKLFISKQDVVISATPNFVRADNNGELKLSVDFKIVSNSGTATLDPTAVLDELSNPVAGFLIFSPGLNLPQVQIKFP